MLLKKSGHSSCSLGNTYYIYQIRDISSKLLKITPIFKSDDELILTETTTDLSLYFQILIEYSTKLFITD